MRAVQELLFEGLVAMDDAVEASVLGADRRVQLVGRAGRGDARQRLGNLRRAGPFHQVEEALPHDVGALDTPPPQPGVGRLDDGEARLRAQ